MRQLRFVGVCLWLLVSAGGASAQTIESYPTADGLKAPATVSMCVTAGVAAPCGASSNSAVTGAAGAFVDGWSVTLGSTTDSAWSGSGAGSEMAVLKAIETKDAGVLALMPALNGDGGALTHVTNWPATQAVSGSVSVSNFPATQPVSGSLSVSNFPASQAVTGAFWQATQPVSGSVSVSNFPSTQAVTQSGAWAVSPNSGSFAGYWSGLDGYPQNSTTAGQYGTLMQCGVVSGNPSVTAADSEPCWETNTGNIRMQLYSGTAAVASTVANGAAAGGVGGILTFTGAPSEVTSTNGQAPQGNPYGAAFGDNEGIMPSDSSFASFTPTTGVLWSECGSASKTIHIKSLVVQGFAGTAGSYVLQVLKTSTAPSGGTATALTFVADTTVGATSNTATGSYYTAAPTGGTSLGAVAGGIVPFPVAGGMSMPVNLLAQGAPTGTQAIALSGTAQCVEISTTTAALTTPTMVVAEAHTEQ